MKKGNPDVICTLCADDGCLEERVVRAFRAYLQSLEAKEDGAIPMQGGTVYPPVARG